MLGIQLSVHHRVVPLDEGVVDVTPRVTALDIEAQAIGWQPELIEAWIMFEAILVCAIGHFIVFVIAHISSK
jgi:hypothetical protein